MGALLSMFPLWMVGLWLLACIALCVHAVRTGREMFWLWVILVFQPIGAIVYIVAILLPEQLRGAGAQRLGAAARDALDPGREYREARQAVEETPTVRNQSRLAHAAAALGRFDEAERLYAEAAHGIHADDPALLLGRANALLELNRGEEAVATLERLTAEPEGHTPAATLAFGRAYDAVGRTAEAETFLRDAAERVPGFEGMARLAAFLRRHGRRAEAQEIVADLDRRMAKLRGPFRKEAHHWRELAARDA
ncbi:tetratricopeptide repeat protein [Phenylobacterium sp.]|uniref:tetratricopeptide repeat protein n=1 Tax=Phenylobacterium sp. TaxID=1871053 RepID=UPI0025FD4916|nr:tetratricopeptide repeat protein [Phenylobacterium sp.]